MPQAQAKSCRAGREPFGYGLEQGLRAECGLLFRGHGCFVHDSHAHQLAELRLLRTVKALLGGVGVHRGTGAVDRVVQKSLRLCLVPGLL